MKQTTRGFTLIELLIVVVIIGILAAIAIPKFAATKQNAYIATVKTDLRNLATAEEGYAANHSGSYFGGTATSTSPQQNYAPSANVTVTITGSSTSWSATAVHSLIPAASYPGGKSLCAIYYNTTAVLPASQDGVPAC